MEFKDDLLKGILQGLNKLENMGAENKAKIQKYEEKYYRLSDKEVMRKYKNPSNIAESVACTNILESRGYTRKK